MNASARALVRDLLDWYGKNARDLPWRRDPTPYRVLLSELMLQQTRVETVIPYFERFLVRWPTVEALAAAEIDAVLHAWAGLGYYSRARNLHRCAVAAVERGGVPGDVDGLRELPGIGPYTAGAVASIAFGVRAPLVDGNVERVLCRIDGRSEDPRSTTGRKGLWERAAELQTALTETEAPGDLNQALMELGATVCLPRNPSCPVCPVRAHCVANAQAAPERYPSPIARAKPTPVSAVHALVQRDGGWVVGQRPPGLLGGLWEPIGGPIEADADPEVALAPTVLERAGLVVVEAERLGVVRHTFSHRELTATVFAVAAAGDPRAGGGYRELRILREPSDLALSKLARKLLALGERRG